MTTNTSLLWGRDTEAISVAAAGPTPQGADPKPPASRPQAQGVAARPTLLSLLVERTERQVGAARMTGARRRA